MKSTKIRLLVLGVPIVAVVAATVTLLILSLGSLPGPVYAADFIVDSTEDFVDAAPGDGSCDDGQGNCTLRAAIQEANALSPPETITVPAGKYILDIAGSGEDAAATGDLDITDDVTIVGAGAVTTTVDGADLDRVFHIQAGADVLIAGMGIANGTSPGGQSGGGIRNDATLTLVESAVAFNVTGASGGGIANTSTGVLTIANSVIDNNVTPALGGGIYNFAGDVLVVNSTISSNASDGTGGGINQGGASAAMLLINVTIADNASDADDNGTGPAGGIAISAGTGTLSNTLIANNTANSSVWPDCFGITSAGYNLIGDTSGCIFVSTTGDQLDIDPLLGTLRANGGPTATHLIPVVSPAADAGSPQPPGSGGTSCATTDQRGDARPKDADHNTIARCDIGAFEVTGASEVACPNVPDLPPPAAGCDRYDFVATLTVDAPTLAADCFPGCPRYAADAHAAANGPYVLNADPGAGAPASLLAPSPIILNCLAPGQIVNDRKAVNDVNPANGLDEVDIEIFFLNGYIDCPGPIALGAGQTSTGTIEELPPNNTPGTLEFPAKIEANLCLQIDTDPDTIFGIVENCPATFLPENREPLSVDCTVTSLTEADCLLGSARFFDTSGAEKANVQDGDIALVQISNIGGVAELPEVATLPVEAESPAGPNTTVLFGVAGVVAVGALALGGAAWRVRRRRASE